MYKQMSIKRERESLPQFSYFNSLLKFTGMTKIIHIDLIICGGKEHVTVTAESEV